MHKWMETAAQLSKIAAASSGVRNQRLAAAVYVKRDLVAVGWNRYKTDAFQLRYGRNQDSIYIHAEIDAIKRAIRSMTNSHYLTYQFPRNTTLLVVRFDVRSGTMKMARPCPGCQRAITDFNIESVIYTNDYGELESL